MTPYQNLSGDSPVVSYKATESTIHVVFSGGTYRNYLYDSSRPGSAIVQRMKELAAAGQGLATYIAGTVKDNYARKW